jgi:hypothetical protein
MTRNPLLKLPQKVRIRLLGQTPRNELRARPQIPALPKHLLTRNINLAHPASINRPILVPYTYSLNPAHRMALAHTGQLSALVYSVKSRQAAEASPAESLYWPFGSVRMAVQFVIATIPPWRVGLPVREFWFTPVQIRSPRCLSLDEVWLTVAVPKAANGQEEPEAVRALFAARIQWARVEGKIPLTVRSALEIGCCGVLGEPGE